MSPGGYMSWCRAFRAGGQAIQSCSSSSLFAAASGAGIARSQEYTRLSAICNEMVVARLREALWSRCSSGIAMRSDD
jgi:hypothetical protein